MFILLAIIIGIIIGFIRGGSFTGFKARKISLLPLGIIGILLQVLLHLYFYTGGVAGLENILPVVNFVSYILILLTLVFNLDDAWAILMAVGLTVSFIVIFINGGKMPVDLALIDEATNFGASVNNGTNAVYTILDQGVTSLWFLGVVIPLPFLTGITQFFGTAGGLSAGGLLTVLGLMGWFQYRMRTDPGVKSLLGQPASEHKDYIIDPDIDREMTGPFKLVDDGEDIADGNSPYGDLFEGRAYRDSDDGYDGEYMDYDEYEEDAVYTDVLPNLDPDTMARFHRDDEDADYDADYETKVFTGIRDLDTGAVIVPEGIERVEDDEDDKDVSSGFFTETFRAEKVKDIVDGTPEEVFEEEDIDEEMAQTLVEEEPAIKIEIDPPVETLAVKAEPTPQEEAEYYEDEEPKSEAWSEDDMRNIWARVNEDTTRRKKHRHTPEYPVTARPGEKASRWQSGGYYNRVKESDKEEISRWRQNDKPKKKMPKTIGDEITSGADVWNPHRSEGGSPFTKEREPAPKTEAQAPKKSRLDTQERLAGIADLKMAISDEEREKAGYEKVLLNVDGREVTFWRKRKGE